MNVLLEEYKASADHVVLTGSAAAVLSEVKLEVSRRWK